MQRLFTLPCLLLIVMLGIYILPASTMKAETAPARPFPQRVTYAANTIRPTNFTQSQQDQHVRSFYDYWKANYLVAAGTNSAGKQMYRVAFGTGSPVTVSEGQGYGMVIVALMAGHDPDAKVLFDGLWYFSRQFPSGIDNRLMSWKIENGQIVDGNDSAFDGDVDIAYGLLLADAQWGSSGVVNYTSEANRVIAGILASTIGPQSRLPMLGDWVNPNGSPHNQYTPRSSDFMPAHFRAFGRATGNSVWVDVINKSELTINSIQAKAGATTGLLPDFLNCSSNYNCSPANAGFLEGPNDGNYYYNAGRDPWRIGLDALLNNDADARAQVQQMVNWLVSDTQGQADNIKAGYTLDGTPIGDYFTTFFVAPFGVAAMTDPSKQAFLNDIYASVYNTRESYFEDSVNLLALLAMTGNYWDPTAGGGMAPTSTPINATPVPPTSTPPVPTPPTPVPGDGCQVDYTIGDDWSTGFTAQVTITNNGSTAMDGWTLTWEFSGNQQITQMWNASSSQSGTQVSATNAGWNATIPAGGSVSFGFHGTYSGTNKAPTEFTLNGSGC
ncbi:MAG: DUF4214 domain-containing protein [Chloroflexi bacterium AL-W]|nr:DUF4214 domain-containing protein [Chloroflexi bacterium AL-W]